MKILIIGGTIFLGKHIVQEALKRGHEVVLFNRGQHNPDLFPQIERLKGDRDSSLDILKHKSWDAVVDTCGYIPRLVTKSASVLSDLSAIYCFISTISVYRDFSQIGIDENYPVATIEEETTELVNDKTYGPLKALCEKEVEKFFPSRSLIIRPGLIVGPDDPTDRFSYWPIRCRKGGKIVIPERPSFPVQIVDVRDLSIFIINMLEKKINDIINVTGPDYKLTFKDILSTSNFFSNKKCKFYEIPENFLKENNVIPFTDLPLWTGSHEDLIGLEQVSIKKAISYGLIFRELKQTIEDTISWFESIPQTRQLRAGLSTEKENFLLRKWKEKVT